MDHRAAALRLGVKVFQKPEAKLKSFWETRNVDASAESKEQPRDGSDFYVNKSLKIQLHGVGFVAQSGLQVA